MVNRAILRERGDAVLSGGEQPLAQRAIRQPLGERGQFVLQYEREAVDEIVAQFHPPRDVLIEVGLGIAEAYLQQFEVVDEFGRPPWSRASGRRGACRRPSWLLR